MFDEIESKLIYGTNVRQVLEYVVRGDVDAGMVYLSDAKAAGDAVKICATVPFGLHEPIRYRAVVINTTDTPDLAKSFIEMMCDEISQSAFESRGFIAPTTQPSK